MLPKKQSCKLHNIKPGQGVNPQPFNLGADKKQKEEKKHQGTFGLESCGFKQLSHKVETLNGFLWGQMAASNYYLV